MKLLAILWAGLMVGCASTPPPIEYTAPVSTASAYVVEDKPLKEKTERELFEKEPQYVGPAPIASEDTKLLVDLASQNFHYYENGEVVRSGPITSGRPGFPTDTGVFYAGFKDKNKKSSLYPKPNGGSPMRYAIQVTGDIFLHEGYMPNYPASHGCIRLWHDDAKFLFKKVKTGDRIVVQ